MKMTLMGEYVSDESDLNDKKWMKIKMTKMDEDENDNQETDKSNF